MCQYHLCLCLYLHLYAVPVPAYTCKPYTRTWYQLLSPRHIHALTLSVRGLKRGDLAGTFLASYAAAIPPVDIESPDGSRPWWR